jgi:hypothetical protein
MAGVTQQRTNEIQNAATLLVASIGIEAIDALPDDARKPQLVALAHQLQSAESIHYETARNHIARACRRARGQAVKMKRGGSREGAGRPPKRLQLN